jgi:SAM-dependent methyltransferase
MDELSTEYVISTYNKSLMMHGDRPEAVNWTEKGQRLRFETLLSFNESIDGKKILDYGCGKGDFYQFLKERGIIVSYTGYDINENLINMAKQKYPECRFKILDIDNTDADEVFDYIFLCGVFNLKLTGLVDIAKSSLKKLFASCRRALVFNALSSLEKKTDFTLQYFDPAEMLSFAAHNLSPYITLCHGRDPYDFTMFVHKDSFEKI